MLAELYPFGVASLNSDRGTGGATDVAFPSRRARSRYDIHVAGRSV
jgi:hypothetical protein